MKEIGLWGPKKDKIGEWGLGVYFGTLFNISLSSNTPGCYIFLTFEIPLSITGCLNIKL